jgi:hypothetical protein
MEPINLRFGAVDQSSPPIDMGKSAIVCVTETSGSNPCIVSVGDTPFTMQVPANGMVLIRKKPVENISISSGSGSMTGVAFAAATGISQDAPSPFETSTVSFLELGGISEWQVQNVDFSSSPVLIIETPNNPSLAAAFNSYPGGAPQMNDVIQFHWLASAGDPIDTTKILLGVVQGIIPGGGPSDDQLVVIIPPGMHPTLGHDLTVSASAFAYESNPFIKIELPST